MLLGFIGAPCSGKTTIATKFFSVLKENGNNSELIVEQARQFIANKRFKEKLPPNGNVILTDNDQIEIASKQREIEQNMKYSCGYDTIIVSDSSVFNSFLYMSDNYLDNDDLLLKLNGHYDLIFYCYPIDINYLPDDPNRVHNLDTIKLIQNKSLVLLNKLKELGFVVHELFSSLNLEQRYEDVSKITMDYYLNIAKTA